MNQAAKKIYKAQKWRNYHNLEMKNARKKSLMKPKYNNSTISSFEQKSCAFLYKKILIISDSLKKVEKAKTSAKQNLYENVDINYSVKVDDSEHIYQEVQ